MKERKIILFPSVLLKPFFNAISLNFSFRLLLFYSVLLLSSILYKFRLSSLSFKAKLSSSFNTPKPKRSTDNNGIPHVVPRTEAIRAFYWAMKRAVSWLAVSWSLPGTANSCSKDSWWGKQRWATHGLGGLDESKSNLAENVDYNTTRHLSRTLYTMY